MGNEVGLTAYYRLDDHTTTVTDATGHGNTGTLTNGDVNANYTQSGAAIDTVHALPGIPSLVTLAGFDYLAPRSMMFSITRQGRRMATFSRQFPDVYVHAGWQRMRAATCSIYQSERTVCEDQRVGKREHQLRAESATLFRHGQARQHQRRTAAAAGR